MDVRYYIDEDGVKPVIVWLEGLADKQTKARIISHLGRMRLGVFGDWKPVGDGVNELRINFGPGFRVYYARHGPAVVILLCGGSKGTQRQDIKTAKVYWDNYKNRISVENDESAKKRKSKR